MEFINDGTTLVLKEKNFEYKVVLEELLKKNGAEVIDVLEKNKIIIPRSLNCSALRDILNLKIVKARLLDLSDEMLYRLRFYPSFSEYQLQSLFKTICSDEESFKNYLLAFYDKVINNAGQLGLTDDHIMMILILDNKDNNFSDFENALFKITRDFKNDFDGVNSDDLKESLQKSATTTDLRELGDKYGINIPKRLRRNEIEKIIMGELKKQDKLDDDLKERIKKMPVMTLQRLAKNNNIRVSADLKKEDIIEYLFADADKALAKPMKHINLVGLESDFEFKASYVDPAEDQENRPATNQQGPELSSEATDLIRDLVKEIHESKETKEVIREVNPANEETNELLKTLVTEMQNSNNNRSTEVIREVGQASVDEETKNLLKELILEMRKQNEKPVAEANPQVINNEAPKVNVENKIDTEGLVIALDRITKATKELTAARLEAGNVNSNQVVEVKVLKDEEEPEAIENVYPFDNFANQTNPLYDEKLALNITNSDRKRINEDYVLVEEMKADPLSKIDRKSLKIQEKLDKKNSKSLAKKEKSDEKKALKKESKLNKKANKQARKEELKLAKLNKKAADKRYKEMEKALSKGRMENISTEEFDKFMRVKQYKLDVQASKRQRHERRMRRLGLTFKTILVIALLLAITWLVFACLFAFDIALNVRDMFKTWNIGEWNFYDGLFAGIVEQIKGLIPQK